MVFLKFQVEFRKFEISHQFTGHFGTNTSLPEGLRQLMAYFGNASRQLLERLQGFGRTHPDLRKVRFGHKDYVIMFGLP